MRRAIPVAVALACAVPGGVASADRAPGAAAQSWAVRVVVPGGTGGSTAAVSVPPAGKPVTSGSFVYPADGSVIVTGQTTASADTKIGHQANATASSGVETALIFGGEITADSVTASATAATGSDSANGNFDGTGVVGLNALGNTVTKRRVALGNWGYLTLQSSGIDTSAPRAAAGYRGFITAVDVHLTAPHGGLPAGSEIQLGHAEVDVQTAPGTVPAIAPPAAPGAPLGPLPGDRPQLLPKTIEPLVGVPQLVTPSLGVGTYVFPVYGVSSYIDTYGGDRSDVNYHHGDDIFGELGQPLLAVADGTVFSVGWNRLGGNRLWLRDHRGNLFYYAHLAAFSISVRNGARVNAGEVIGFMGNTGDAEGTSTHLHFEVHPVSLIYLGYDGAVDPTTYLQSWKRIQNLPFPIATGWAPSPPGIVKAAEPGAMLIGTTDIASTAGLSAAKPRR
jgi:murein DD-endopeptidase MepM/ murein hydrolase activator NlpD